jgi:RimJ/RimL family protein N-acetyltransferase
MNPYDPTPSSALAAAPLLTPRLILRPLTDADAPALYEIHAHSEVMRYWAWPAWTEIGQAHRMIADSQVAYASGSAHQFGIERRADGALVGTCSLFRFHLPSRRAELGYALGRPFWGAGYMNEALHALLDHAFFTLNLHRVEADIDPRNRASAKTLERLGFQKEGHLRERWIVDGEISDTAWYGLLGRAWAEQS